LRREEEEGRKEGDEPGYALGRKKGVASRCAGGFDYLPPLLNMPILPTKLVIEILKLYFHYYTPSTPLRPYDVPLFHAASLFDL
jgi:hypothetical protein